VIRFVNGFETDEHDYEDDYDLAAPRSRHSGRGYCWSRRALQPEQMSMTAGPMQNRNRTRRRARARARLFTLLTDGIPYG
jgi:hypothetical protein